MIETEAHDKLIDSCAYREPQNEEENTAQNIEIVRCQKSFPRFLHWVKLVEPPTQTSSGGVLPLLLWPHISMLVNAFLTEKLIVILKSRQIGASWIVASYVLWHALTHVGSKTLMQSMGEAEAMELLSKCKAIYDNLPPFMQYKVNPNSLTEIGFPVMKSVIKAMPSTEKAGTSYAASILVYDEWEEHEYAEQNFMAAKPTISAGGQCIGIFTVNTERPQTVAKDIEAGAYAGTNGWKAYFIPYTARPGRTDEWYKKEMASIPASKLKGLTPELYMQRNFPATREEALRPISSVTAFSHKILDEMMGETKNPVKVEASFDPNICKVYIPFYLGELYIAGTDTSHGMGKDYSATCVMNVKTGQIVADIFNNRISPEELAFHSMKLLDYYHTPLWFPESNEYGSVTINKATNLGYNNFGYSDEKKTKVGFDTRGYKTASGLKGTRTDLFSELMSGINNHQITIYNSDGLKQFYDIIRRADKEGRIDAMEGRHDDYVIAVGICWMKRNEVNVPPFEVTEIRTLHFRR